MSTQAPNTVRMCTKSGPASFSPVDPNKKSAANPLKSDKRVAPILFLFCFFSGNGKLDQNSKKGRGKKGKGTALEILFVSTPRAAAATLCRASISPLFFGQRRRKLCFLLLLPWMYGTAEGGLTTSPSFFSSLSRKKRGVRKEASRDWEGDFGAQSATLSSHDEVASPPSLLSLPPRLG